MKNVTITFVAALILSGLGTVAGAQTPAADAAASAMFSRLDADQDGAVTMAEMNEAKAAQFARADRDGNGLVDAAEMAAIRDRLAKLRSMANSAADLGLARMDSDGDGAVSLAEYTARAPFFVLMDGDGDGVVTRAEFDRARAAFSN
jgi:Ca2+-binding EF-hand superfamily protein